MVILLNICFLIREMVSPSMVQATGIQPLRFSTRIWWIGKIRMGTTWIRSPLNRRRKMGLSWGRGRATSQDRRSSAVGEEIRKEKIISEESEEQLEWKTIYPWPCQQISPQAYPRVDSDSRNQQDAQWPRRQRTSHRGRGTQRTMHCLTPGHSFLPLKLSPTSRPYWCQQMRWHRQKK